jgi:hypothetical protein
VPDFLPIVAYMDDPGDGIRPEPHDRRRRSFLLVPGE